MTDDKYLAKNFERRLLNTAITELESGHDELADIAIANYRAFRDAAMQAEGRPPNLSSFVPMVRVSA